MGSIEEQQLIENYLAGRLSREEKISFEKRMARDTRFKLSVDTHSSLQHLLSDEKLVSFRRLVDDVRQELEEDENKSNALKIVKVRPRKRWRQMAAIAATVLIVLVPAYWLLFYQDTMTTGQIAGEFMKPYPLPGVFRGGSEETKLKALEAYEAGRYEEARIHYENLMEIEPENELHLFATGLCYLFGENPKNAIPIFQKILNEKHQLIEQQARWYLAMSYLKTDDSVTAKNILKSIEKGTYKYAEAQKALSRL